jgi:hypothetical protein
MLRKVTSSSKMSSRATSCAHRPGSRRTLHADAPSSPHAGGAYRLSPDTDTRDRALAFPLPPPLPAPAPRTVPKRTISPVSPPTAPRYHLCAPGRWSALSRSLGLVARVAGLRSLSRELTICCRRYGGDTIWPRELTICCQLRRAYHSATLAATSVMTPSSPWLLLRELLFLRRGRVVARSPPARWRERHEASANGL